MTPPSRAGHGADVQRIRRSAEHLLSRGIARCSGVLAAVDHRLGSRVPAATPERYDSWLRHYHDETLRAIDAACGRGDPEALARFRELDVDLWALLLSREYDDYPNIRALLPDLPDPALQELWNGASGLVLANQTKAFYVKLIERFTRHGPSDLAAARVLDFGCGWGRITRFLARDVAPGNLCGCDPVEEILDVCRQSRLPATLARSEFVPRHVPFEGSFDLAFSFSVFTHISEAACLSSLRALHEALRPGGLLVITVRPPAYLHHSPLMAEQLKSLGPDPDTALEEPRYLFAPHAAEESHFQYAGGEMTYGETVMTMAYLREHLTPQFELLDVAPLVGDLYQVMVTLRAR